MYYSYYKITLYCTVVTICTACLKIKIDCILNVFLQIYTNNCDYFLKQY